MKLSKKPAIKEQKRAFRSLMAGHFLLFLLLAVMVAFRKNRTADYQRGSHNLKGRHGFL